MANASKICSKCGVEWPISEFNKSKKVKSGLRSNCRYCEKIYREQNRNNQNKYKKQWYITNIANIAKRSKAYREQNRNKITEYKKSLSRSSSYIHKLPPIYQSFLDDNGYVNVKCYKCGKYFVPTNSMISHCICAFNGKGRGQHNLYCSQSCKDDCDVFYQIKTPKGYLSEDDKSRELQPELRILRFGMDNFKCQRCGSGENLNCHHITGIEINPIESADIDNCITLCNKCHKMVHNENGCNMRRQKCDEVTNA